MKKKKKLLIIRVREIIFYMKKFMKYGEQNKAKLFAPKLKVMWGRMIVAYSLRN